MRWLGLLLLLSSVVAQAQKAVMSSASLDIRSWENQEGDRDRLGERAYNVMRLATWSVKFDRDIKVKHGNGPSRSMNEFKTFETVEPWYNENLMQLGMKGINLQFKCQMDAGLQGGTPGTTTEQIFATKKETIEEGEFPVDWIIMLPSATNAFSRWFQRFLGGLQIFAESDVWAEDSLTFGSVTALTTWETPDCSETGPGCASSEMTDKKKPGQSWMINLEMFDLSSCVAEVLPSDGSAGDWVIVDAETDVPLDPHTISANLVPTACTPQGLAEVGPKLDIIIDAMASATDPKTFKRVDETFSQLYSMDGWAGCLQMVESMVTLEKTTEFKPPNRECTEQQETDCNESERDSDGRCPFNQAWLDDPCCNPEKAFQQCCVPRDTEVSATIINSFTFAENQCSEVRRSEVENAMGKFQAAIKLRNHGLSGCTAIRQRKTGDSNMKDLTSFFSTCSTKIYQQQTKTGGDICAGDDDCFTYCNQNESPPRCAYPHFDAESAWIKCSLYEMDPKMNNFFRESLGLTVADSVDDVYNKMLEMYGQVDCIGETARQGGGCWANVNQATCDSAGQSARWEEASPYAADGYKCRTLHFHLNDHDYTNQGVPSPCLGECQCKDHVSKHFTGADGKFELFRNVYGHVWNETSMTNENIVVAAGTEEGCLRDKRCNWNSQITDSSSCTSTLYGSKFCARTDGHRTREISHFPRCPMTKNLADSSAGWDIFKQSECTANGGTWMPSQHDPDGFHDCHDCCSFTSTPPVSEGSCINETICKKFTGTHVFDEYTHYGECQYQAFCYDSNTFGNETDCMLKNLANQPGWAQPEYNYGDWDVWPKYTFDNEEYDGADGTQFEWKYYLTHANLKVRMCMHGRRWGAQSSESQGTYTTQATCEAAGYAWHIPRHYQEGRWATESDCLQGSCSSDPWDHRLANPAICTQQAGSCTERCKKCERHDQGLDSVMCVAKNITNEMDCKQIANMQWRSNYVFDGVKEKWVETENRACVGQMTNTDCTGRNDHVQVACSHVSWEDCETVGRTGLYQSVFGGCYQERHAQCETESGCQSTGQCDDWSYEYWDWDETQKRNQQYKACRVPHKPRPAPDQGIDWEACSSLAVTLGNIPYDVHHEDACFLYKVTPDICTGAGGTMVERADTQADCENRKQCFNKQHHYPISHTMDKDECENSCDETRFEWRSVRQYRSGIWSAATMQPGEWTDRAMVQSNQWRQRADYVIRELLVKAVYRMWAESYKTEQLCLIEPYVSVFKFIACACNPSGTEPAECSDVFSSEITTTNIAEYCCFADVTCNIVTSAGVLAIRKESMEGLDAGCHKQQMSFGFSGDQIQNTNRRRQISASTCNDYALVPGTAGGVVGQIIGNAFQVQGIGFLGTGKSVTVCVPIDSNVPTCTGKYDILDLSKGKSDKTPGPPLFATVTNEGGQLCAAVTTDGETSMLFFPILRTKNGLPHVGFIGQVVKAEVKITGFAAKEVFTVERQAAFKTALAQVISNGVLSADDIVLLKICDVHSNGNVGDCTAVYSNRRSTGAGINVQYQVQVSDNSGVSTSDVRNKMTGNSFSRDFTTALNTYLTDGSSISVALAPGSVKETIVTASNPPTALTPRHPTNSPDTKTPDSPMGPAARLAIDSLHTIFMISAASLIWLWA